MKRFAFLYLLILLPVLSFGDFFAPVKYSFRTSKLDSTTYVLQLQNTSEHHLYCELEIRDPSDNYKTVKTFQIKPHKSKEVGAMQGWVFESGHKCKLVISRFTSVFSDKKKYPAKSFKVP